MFNSIKTQFQKILSFSLSDIKGFPESVYNELQAKYTEYDSWYSGDALKEQEIQGGEAVDLYPLRINPIKTAVLKHAFMLFGEVEDNSPALVIPRILTTNEDKQSIDDAQRVEDLLSEVLKQSHGRALQMENGIASQIHGGCIYRIRHTPWDTFANIKFKIEKVAPSEFMGIPDAGDPYSLCEAWVVRQITKEEATSFNVNVGDDPAPYWVEHWTKQDYEITINGEVISKTYVKGDASVTKVFSGPNPYGFIPMVYAPCIRSKGFYGESIIDGLPDLVKEINSRFADFGDAVSTDSHQTIAMRNVHGKPTMVRISPNLSVVNLKSTANVTSGDKPDLFMVGKQVASEPMAKLNVELYKQYRRQAFVPAVADGEDEGSQRSGATLNFRMWPLTSHAKQERIFLAPALDRLYHMLVLMMRKKGVGDIPEDISHWTIRQEWPPMLPKDREAMINEAMVRIQHGLGSPEFLLDFLGDVDDIPGELEKIIEWLRIKNPVENSNKGDTENDQEEK